MCYQFITKQNTNFEISNAITKFLPFEPTAEQIKALAKVQSFIDDTDDFLIIKGAAGTGKTSIMKAVADYLEAKKVQFQLLAPTGRAAKNIASKTNFPANTIHSTIYKVESNPKTLIVNYTFKANNDENHQVFIVDESSMIGDKINNQEQFRTPGTLIADFVKFFKGGNKTNKVIFVGDSCQLPPVGYSMTEESPALFSGHLIKKYGFSGSTFELSKVMRQQEGSSILGFAYQVRDCILNTESGVLPQRIGQYMGKAVDASRTYLSFYHPSKHDKVAIISYGNSYAMDCNKIIRAELGLSGILTIGDKVVLNQNYYGSASTFLSNGEVGVIKNVSHIQKIANVRFVDAEIEFSNFQGMPVCVQSKILLETLVNPESITSDIRKELAALAFKNNPTYRKSMNIWDDPYLSAMQLSYGHAFTCHKAQGSEWDTVLLNSWSPNKDLRFLYTGITRARKNLYTNGSHNY